MPFTFSHPLYAAPLKAAAPGYLSLTGLILGSMSPDFEYFIMLEPYRSIGHTHTGLFLHAIPLCILLAFLFHYVVKRPLAQHLPSWFKLDARAGGLLADWPMRSLRSWAVFVVSVAIGFYLHIFIDEWTHRTGYFVALFPALREMVLGIPLYSWLQYSLSLFGLLAEALFVLWLLVKAPICPRCVKRSSSDKAVYWLIVFAIASITVALKLGLTSSSNTLGIAVVAPISGMLLGLVVASACSKLSGKE